MHKVQILFVEHTDQVRCLLQTCVSPVESVELRQFTPNGDLSLCSLLPQFKAHVFSKMNGPIPEGKELHQVARGQELSRGISVSVVIAVFLVCVLLVSVRHVVISCMQM